MNRVYAMVGPNKVFVRKKKGEDTYEVGLAGGAPVISVAGDVYRKNGIDETAKLAVSIALEEGLLKEVA